MEVDAPLISSVQTACLNYHTLVSNHIKLLSNLKQPLFCTPGQVTCSIDFFPPQKLKVVYLLYFPLLSLIFCQLVKPRNVTAEHVKKNT